MTDRKAEIQKEIMDIIAKGIERLGSSEPLDSVWFEESADRLDELKNELIAITTN